MALLSRKGAWVYAQAPAKVNLFLHITGRRDDGLHELESLFVFTDFGDEVRVRAADEFSLSVTGPFAHALDGDARDNLVMQAARALQATAGISVGAEIILTKNLPIAAGIGGGSSDAAATMRALEVLWGVDIGVAKRHDLAASLGADVPACLDMRPKLVRGIGEKLTSFDVPEGMFIVLANPGVALSTPAVFGAYKCSGTAFTDVHAAAKLDWPWVLQAGNDLQLSAIELAPAIQQVLDVMDSGGRALKVGMSGSGATCFALFATQEDAKKCTQAIAKLQVDIWSQGGYVLAVSD